MKKQILLAAFAAVFSIAGANAQPPGGGMRMSVEDRVKAIDEKLAVFSLDKDKAAKVDAVFTTYFTAQQKAMEDMRAAGGEIDREALKASRQKLADERDAQLKQLFTDDQYKKWKDEIEPTTRPQRGGNKPAQQ